MGIEISKVVAWVLGIAVALVILAFISSQLTTERGLMAAVTDGLRNLLPDFLRWER